MNKKITTGKELLSPPGDTIQETIEYIGMSQKELAERLGKSPKNVNRIIKGLESITTNTALQLERVLGIPCDFWLERERIYRKELAQIEFQKNLEKKSAWLKYFPIKEMQKLNWIPKSEDSIAVFDSILRFFGIASHREWNRIYVSIRPAVSFRMSLSRTSSPHAISAWLRQGEIQAKGLSLSGYNKSDFHNSFTVIKKLAFEHPKDFHLKLQEICAECGVAVVYTPCISKATISGAARWVFNGTVPLIQLSGRYKTNDHFWFTFFHEAAHIILHSKKEIFLEEVEGSPIEKDKEEEANIFAGKTLISDDVYDNLLKLRPINVDIIQGFSKAYRIHPGIVVGRLQYDGIIPFNRFNSIRAKINLANACQ